MNYLAHAYLSFNHPQVLAGNMISDFVKGSARFGFNGNIQQGIYLHRQIDAFTDDHPATRKAKEVFRPAYRLYSGAIIDIIYDHYLANDPEIFSEQQLQAFSKETYRLLDAQSAELPPRFLHAFTYMKAQDWLFHYRLPSGIENALKGLVRRAAYLSESDTAHHLFREHYGFLKTCYEEFFPDVKQFAKQKFGELLL